MLIFWSNTCVTHEEQLCSYKILSLKAKKKSIEVRADWSRDLCHCRRHAGKDNRKTTFIQNFISRHLEATPLHQVLSCM